MHQRLSLRNPPLFRPFCTLVLFCLAWLAHADNADLLQQYQALKPALDHNVYGIPVSIRSTSENRIMLGEVYGVLTSAYADVSNALTSAQTWCDIVPLHLNIKACTFQQRANDWQVVLYTGRKFYEKADDVYQLTYRFIVAASTATYFQTVLTAAEGPLGTSNYRIEAEAIPLTALTTFIHFRYSYQYNFLTSLSMNTYLATLGSGKVGFSVTGKNAEGEPIYVDGIRGIIERNTIRYYFAIQSYLDTRGTQPAGRLQARLLRWFELTERYPLQLHELEQPAYLQAKQQEHADQLRLQRQMTPASGQPAGS